MRFTYGEVSRLEERDWYPLELRSEQCVEIYLRRVVRVIPGIFKREPAELYVPLKNRDLNEFELLEGPFIYVRSEYFIGLVRLKKVWGVVGLETTGGSRLLKDTIKVDKQYVKRLQELEEMVDKERIKGLTKGVGVRVLDGYYRDLCGTVQEEIDEKRVLVMLDLGFRKIELSTYRHNLRVIRSNGKDCCWVPDLLREEETELIKTEGI